MPHRTGSPTKRELQKVEEEMLLMQDELINTRRVLGELQEQNQEMSRKVDRLNNVGKCRSGKRGKAKGKQDYSKSQKRRQKKQHLESLQSALKNVSTSTCEPVSITFKDELGDEVVVHCGNERKITTEYCKDDIDEMIFILDQYNIPNRGYHELAQSKSTLPKACRVIERRHELNKRINIVQTAPEYPGVYTSLSSSLVEKLADPQRAHVVKDGKVRIKLSGDGTRITCKQSFVNLSYTLVDEETCMSEHGNYLLAIVKCREDNTSLKSALCELITEFETLTCVTVNGQDIEVEKYLGGDLKYLNQIMGIAGFASKHSCLWCKCSKEQRHDMKKAWSINDPECGARTIQDIVTCSKKKLSDPTKFCCNEHPIFLSVPIYWVVQDTLHLCLRICDQLVGHLFAYLLKLDNISKHTVTKKKLENSVHVNKFQEFIHDKVGISDWKFYINNGKIEYRSFRGPEHRKILKNMDLESLIPNHPKLDEWKILWQNFPLLLAEMRKNDRYRD
ncbi:uncharacterized protein LOC119737819 [Patiria miniata]|uniref:Uncharacterized protein n=1 Tax=Patiria miniata TaxID=46514 RepID=A0A914AXE1_PATMI|nr:uncharacterized protein LOC119737819 [Patiria miniata]